MPPKATKLTSFLPQQKKTQVIKYKNFDNV